MMFFNFLQSLEVKFEFEFCFQTGKSLTAKGMEVLERVGKETMDLLIEETGLQVENNSEGEVDHSHIDEEQLEEEDVTFDRCFYIYGGPDQLEVPPLPTLFLLC